MNFSIVESQRKYFQILNKYFGSIRVYASVRNLDINDAAEMAAVGGFDLNISALREELFDYWEGVFSELSNFVMHLPGSNMYFGGDLSPSSTSIINRLGMYTDTIVVPDPVLKILDTSVFQDDSSIFFLVKHALKILDFETLISSDLDQPIIVIFPSQILFNRLVDNVPLKDFVESNSVNYLNEFLDPKFGSFKEWLNFLSKVSSYQEFEKMVSKPEMFLVETNVDQDLRTQVEYLQQLLSSTVKQTYLEDVNGYSFIAMNTLSRMGQAGFLSTKANGLLCAPVSDAPVSWHYFKTCFADTEILNLDTTMGSTFLFEDDFNFLGSLPLDLLVNLRITGELQELRDLFRKEVSPLNSSTKTAAQVVYNLNAALKLHHAEVAELDSSLRHRAKIAIPTLLTTVGFGAAALKWPDIAAVPAIMHGMLVGGDSVLDLAKEREILVKKKKAFSKSFLGFYASNKTPAE